MGSIAKKRDDVPDKKLLPSDERGLDADARSRILSYRAPDRRRSDSPEAADTQVRRRRDDEPKRPTS